MSYSMSLYAVSLSDVHAACGSPNPELLHGIRQKHPGRLASQSANGGPTVETALQRLLAGQPVEPCSESQQAYALELLCDAMGERVDCSALSETNLGFMAEVLAVPSPELSAEQAMLTSRPPGLLPAYDGFPIVGHLTLAEIQGLLSAWTDDALESPEQEILAARYDVRECFEYVAKLGRDLVSFCY